MRTAPFQPNTYGLYTLYNGKYKAYAHELAGRKSERRTDPQTGKDYTCELPIASEPVSSMGARYHKQEQQAQRKAPMSSPSSKPLSPVEGAE